MRHIGKGTKAEYVDNGATLLTLKILSTCLDTISALYSIYVCGVRGEQV